MDGLDESVPSERILSKICEVAHWLSIQTLEPQVNACHNLLASNQPIDVAVVGRFKAGKSSLLNDLAGRDLLPVGVTPVTAAITRLLFGEHEHAVVYFTDGNKREVPVSTVADFVSETRNPGNEKHVAAVDVKSPALRNYAGLRFVDTPGLGSAFAHNTETATEWLPNVGAAIVAVSADAPLGEGDLALIGDLRRFTPNIVVVLTKADLLDDAEQSEVRAFVENQLAKKWGDHFSVFLYSTQSAFGYLKSELQRSVLSPLKENHGGENERILAHKLDSLLAQTINYLNVALAAATQIESARIALREKIQTEQNQFTLLLDELRTLSRECEGATFEHDLKHLEKFEAPLFQKLNSELKNNLAGWDFRIPKLVSTYRQWLGELLRHELAGISFSEKSTLCAPLHKAKKHLERTIRAFQDRLSQHVRTALNVELPPREFDLEVKEPSAPPVDVGKIFDTSMDVVGLFMPTFLFRRFVERRFASRLGWEIEKNLSRLASEWRDRVNAAIRAMTNEAERFVEEELSTLEKLCAQTKSNENQLGGQIEELIQLRKTLLVGAGESSKELAPSVMLA